MKKPKKAKAQAAPAKKAATVKKKSQPVKAAAKPAAKAKAPAKGAKPVPKVTAKAAPKAAAAKAKAPAKGVKAAPPTKAEAKDLKKKLAAPAPAAPVKGAKAAAPAKGAEKAGKKAAPPVEAPAVPVKGKASAKKAAETAQKADAAQQPAEDEEVILTDADGRRYCRVKDCDQAATVDMYCRYHYLLFWRNIQNRKKILSEGKLERYVEELTARYPDKFLELLRKDLRSEKDFTAAIQELEIDDSSNENEFEDEAQSFIDEVRGMSETPATERDEEF